MRCANELKGTTEKTRTTTDFGTELDAYIRRSNYLDDSTFAGSFKDLRIYDGSFGEDQVQKAFEESQIDIRLNEIKNILVYQIPTLLLMI